MTELAGLKFSANLGFLWADQPLPDAIRAAKAAGFDAVELHWPYETPPQQVRAALEETGLPVLGLNAPKGDVSAGENGLAAVPGRHADARDAVDQAVDYATRIGAKNIHVLAGFAAGPEAQASYLDTLDYASRQAEQHGLTILIEPLNRHDAPGYFLASTDHAREIIDTLGAQNLRLMFDCYHVGRSEGDVVTRLTDLKPVIGHIQFAAVPDRGPPDHGELNYAYVFDAIRTLNWTRPIGAEYKPQGPTEASLDWLSRVKAGSRGFV